MCDFGHDPNPNFTPKSMRKVEYHCKWVGVSFTIESGYRLFATSDPLPYIAIRMSQDWRSKAVMGVRVRVRVSVRNWSTLMAGSRTRAS